VAPYVNDRVVLLSAGDIREPHARDGHSVEWMTVEPAHCHLSGTVTACRPSPVKVS
jgi:hypothetical protein